MGWHDQAVAWGEKYMKILGTKGRMPVFKIADNLGSKWLGICRWRAVTPWETTITFQKSIVDDPKTFERVAAHEMIHHHDYLNITKEEIALLRMGVKTDGHGKDFLAGAAKINEVMGKDFVTKTSDAEYVLSKEVKTYFLYMEPRDWGIAYGWAVRLSPQAQRALARRISFHKGKLVETNDRRWTNCGGKIGAKIAMCKTSKPEDNKALEELYDKGKPAPLMIALLPPKPMTVSDLTGGRAPTETEKRILSRLGYNVNEEAERPRTTAPSTPLPPPPKPAPPPAPKLHKFEAGAKQGKLF